MMLLNDKDIGKLAIELSLRDAQILHKLTQPIFDITARDYLDIARMARHS